MHAWRDRCVSNPHRLHAGREFATLVARCPAAARAALMHRTCGANRKPSTPKSAPPTTKPVTKPSLRASRLLSALRASMQRSPRHRVRCIGLQDVARGPMQAFLQGLPHYYRRRPRPGHEGRDRLLRAPGCAGTCGLARISTLRTAHPSLHVAIKAPMASLDVLESSMATCCDECRSDERVA